MNKLPGLNILMARLSHIGDCILTVPVACALRDQLPTAKIVWVVESPAHQLLAGHDAIDELITLPRGWLKQPRVVWKLRRQLRAQRIDVCLDSQSLTKSSLVARLSGAARRIGFTRPTGRELAPLFNNELVAAAGDHLLDRSIGLLAELGVRTPQVAFRMTHDDAADARICQYVETSHLGCGFVVINPGASWPSRRWPPRRFGAVARHLGQAYQVPSVVAWAGPEEREMAEIVVQRSGGHAILAPETSLPELLALLRVAKFYLGGDTGPMHMAASVGIPCVALYGPTRSAKSGAYGTQHIHVQSNSTGKDKRHGIEAIRSIEIEEVAKACDTMLKRMNVKRIDVKAA